jgi:hypothetical protein
MTIGVAGNRFSFNCDGATKIFPVPLQAFLASDFTVVLTAPVSGGGGQSTLVLNSDYSLASSSADTPPKWTLTTLAAAAYPANYSLSVFVSPPQVQQTVYAQGQAFPSPAVQTNFDRLTQMVVLSQALASGTVSAASIGGFLYPQTAAETAAGVTPTNFAYPSGWAPRYGAIADSLTNNSAVFAIIQTLANAGVAIYFPFGITGIYLSSTPFRFTSPAHLAGDPGTRIKLIAAAAYVCQIDGTRGTGGHIYGGNFESLIFDANGFAADALNVKNVINGKFSNIRCTNATTAGLHLNFGQLCTFTNYVCSGHVEAFTATPINGVLADGASSSANLFIEPTIELVSGAGILGTYFINTIFLNGTSEANGIGMVLGHATTGSGIGNTVIGMDMEANATTDIQLLATAFGNDIIGLKGGFRSPACQVKGSVNNHFIGGTCGGITFDATSHDNTVTGMTLTGAGRTITDAGSGNSWSQVYNITDGVVIAEFHRRRRTNFVLDATGAVSIDCSITSLATVTFNGADASTITFNAPTKANDAHDLDIVVHVTGAGALTLAWAGGAGGFKQAGIVVPANGFNRTYRYRYDPNHGFWYLAAQSPVNIPN